MTRELPYVGRQALLSTRVAEELAERILAGEWDGGGRLPSEPELSQRFGVSRSVVRDAIRTLAGRGLVDVRQGFGTIVREPSDEAYEGALFELLFRSGITLGQLVAARERIDLMLAEAAASRRSADDVALLRRHFDEMSAAERAGDWDRTERAHLHFHLAIIAATHEPALEILLQPMQRIVLATSLPPNLEPPGQWDVEVHGPVVDAIARGDADAARAAMHEHYRFARDERYADLHALPFRAAGAAQARIRVLDGAGARRAPG